MYRSIGFSETIPAVLHLSRWRNPARAFNSRGVATHVSEPNKSTPWNTATYNFPAVLLSSPSLPNIFTICPHFSLAHYRFRYTSVQSFSVDDIMRPKYSNDGTAVSGIPFANKTLCVRSYVSATTNLYCFLSVLFRHISEVGCAQFSASCGTNMSHWGHWVGVNYHPPGLLCCPKVVGIKSVPGGFSVRTLTSSNPTQGIATGKVW